MATTTSIVTPVTYCDSENDFSNVATVFPQCNTAVPYTSDGTVFFYTPSVDPEHAPRYPSVNEDYATSPDNPNQIFFIGLTSLCL